jgi:hypothetical protein
MRARLVLASMLIPLFFMPLQGICNKVNLGEHIALGKANVIDSDYNGAFKAALQKALTQAVKDESFKILPSVLILKYRSIIKDEIWNNPAPYVLKYRVLFMGMQGEEYQVKIDAFVERDFLKQRLWQLVSNR